MSPGSQIREESIREGREWAYSDSAPTRGEEISWGSAFPGGLPSDPSLAWPAPPPPNCPLPSSLTVSLTSLRAWVPHLGLFLWLGEPPPHRFCGAHLPVPGSLAWPAHPQHRACPLYHSCKYLRGPSSRGPLPEGRGGPDAPGLAKDGHRLRYP